MRPILFISHVNYQDDQ